MECIDEAVLQRSPLPKKFNRISRYQHSLMHINAVSTVFSELFKLLNVGRFGFCKHRNVARAQKLFSQ